MRHNIKNKNNAILRCSRCLLPDFTPGIHINQEGVCSVCESFKPVEPKGPDLLLKDLESSPTERARYDVLVPISGGLDSFYAAFCLTKRLKLRCTGIHYDHGLGSESKDKMLDWMQDVLEIPVERVRWPKEQTISLVSDSIKALLSSGPRCMQAAICRHCGYGIRASVYSQMIRLGIHSVWGTHTMDSIPFRYCENPDYKRFLSPSCVIHSSKALIKRWSQMRDVPSLGVSRMKVLLGQYGYPYLSQRHKHLKVFSFYNYFPWNRRLMIKELQEAGVDVTVFQKPHSDCALAPLVDFILRAAWGIGKSEIYVSNRIRVGQLSRDEGIELIDRIRNEKIDTGLLQTLGFHKSILQELLSVLNT